jgi:peroxiredoxin
MSLLLTLAGLLCAAQSDSIEVDDFACLDQNGTFQRLARHADAQFVVLYVYANDCPIVRHNAGELKDLAEAFAPRGVRFLGLDPAPQDERAAIAAQASELGLAFPILLDDTQCVAEMLELERTGEALVVATKGWQMRWRGPLDDRLEYGAQKPAAKRHYLREALEALLRGTAPPADAPPSKGCAITFLQPRDKHEVDYARDVAPLLERRCVPCHRAGGIGPWSMDGYKRVRGFAAMIREALLQRRMTPWQLDPLYGSFAGDLGLRPEEVRSLVHWVENGASRGEAEDPLVQVPVPLPEWPLGPPDLVIEIPEQQIPATGILPYRKHTVRLENETERWVRAVDLRPSNASVLHHGFAFLRGQQEAEFLRDRYGRATPQGREKILAWLAELGGTLENPPPAALEHFRREAFPGVNSYFSKYVPGEGIEQFPAGTGRLLPAHAKLTIQMHYTTNGVATSDRPRLGIYFHSQKPERELKVTSAFNTAFVVPAGERACLVTAERTFDEPIRLHALSPHMHYRGRSMRFTAILPDGARETLMSVPEYSFDWQTTYTLAEPRLFPAGTRLFCEAIYDNSGMNERNPDPTVDVRFGPRTEDEMFIGYAIYTLEN